MKNNLFLTILVSFYLILFCAGDAFSSNNETIESLKLKEEELLKKLNQTLSLNKKSTKSSDKISEKKKAINEAINKEIAKNLDNDLNTEISKESKVESNAKATITKASVKNANSQPKKSSHRNLVYKNFSKRLNKRRQLKKQIALKKETVKTKSQTLEAPIIVASNKIIEIENSKISKNLNRHIRKANTILEEIKKEDSKKVATGSKYYTISHDYFDDEGSQDSSSFVYVTRDVSLHTLPSLSSKLIYLVKANTRLKLDKNYGAWYRVKSADNKYGWILGEMINFSDPNSLSTLKNRGKGL